MKLHDSTLSNVRSVASKLLDGTCQFYHRDPTPNQFGVERKGHDVLFSVPNDASTEHDFWVSIGYSPSDNQFPCRLQDVRVDDLRSLDISTDRLFFWLWLPWYMGEVDKYRLTDNKKPLLQEGAAVKIILPVPYGEMEIEQVLAYTSLSRSNLKILLSQRQVN